MAKPMKVKLNTSLLLHQGKSMTMPAAIAAGITMISVAMRAVRMFLPICFISFSFE